MNHRPSASCKQNAVVEASSPMQQESHSMTLSSPPNEQKPASSYVIGADIGGTSLRLALANNSGEILVRWSTSTRDTADAGTVLQLVRAGVNALLREASLPPESLSAIAAGAPGVTDVDEGVVIATSYLMGWCNVPLRQMLEAEFGVPAFVDNDVNLAAIGEQRAGLAQGATDFVFLAIGTGMGAGVVINKQVHRGNLWTAGEIGYMLVPGASDAPVERGEPGPLEAIVGGEGIQAHWQSLWNPGSAALPINATAIAILDHASEYDSPAREVLRLAARTLAYAIYNTSLILNSPLFVLGGSVGIHPALADATRQALESLGARVRPKVICSALGTDAQLIGAIFMAMQMATRKESSLEAALPLAQSTS